MKLRIKATTFAAWQRSTDVHPKQFGATAFNDWTRTLASYRLPLKVSHDMPIPVVGDRNWLQTDTGLQCTCEIDTRNELGLAVSLAVRHKHLTRASMSFLTAYSRTVKVRDRFVEVIDVAQPVELSLTSTPMLSGTSLEIIGEPRMPIAGLPTDRYRADLLAAFLEMIGLPVPPMPKFVSLPQTVRPIPKPIAKPAPMKPLDQWNHGVIGADGKLKWISHAEFERQQQARRDAREKNSAPKPMKPRILTGRSSRVGMFGI